jgi:mRNA interferase MazF
MNPRRGELWRAALDPTLGAEISKTRPCLVLTTNVVNENRRSVVVVPLSSSPSPYPPIRVAVRCAERPAVAVIDQIRAISKQRLRSRIGQASEAELAAVENALKEVLELP